MPSSALEAQLHYLAPLPVYDDVKPYGLLVPLPLSQPRTNIQTRSYDGIVITDLRRCETEMSLDTAGFEFIKHKSSCDFNLKESIENQYLQESSELLKAKLGAESIYVFDYTVRKAKEFGDDNVKGGDKSIRRPSSIVHIDQTHDSAMKRVKLHCPSFADEVAQRRFQIINIWRPIRDAVQDDALCVCDTRTLNPDDVVEADYIFPHYHGEKFLLKYADSHKWYYMKNQDVDEVVLLKIFDSRADFTFGCAHTSFKDPGPRPFTFRRESIEVRCIVFY